MCNPEVEILKVLEVSTYVTLLLQNASNREQLEEQEAKSWRSEACEKRTGGGARRELVEDPEAEREVKWGGNEGGEEKSVR